jgi:hypothetical protein
VRLRSPKLVQAAGITSHLKGVLVVSATGIIMIIIGQHSMLALVYVSAALAVDPTLTVTLISHVA